MATRRPSSVRTAPHEKQPRTFTLTLKALLSLPYRLCNPPPAVGKVRSCQVTPIFKVRLEDVLNRKHLPPLGLKDFEEWLLFVEGCPENLYFMLWLKDYTARYDQWAAQNKPPKPILVGKEQYRFSTPPQPSSNLTLLYLRAKQTFFTPNADYELNIPSDILTPFHTGQFASPIPEPILFAQVAAEVHKMLKDSLDRFVLAAYNNVGTNRAYCGMVGGIVIMLLGSVAPLVVNFANGRARWLRLLALPGMWLGLTVLLASLHGVCMMVYIFGDLRQLRKFELARPRISAPRPLGVNDAHTRPMMSISAPISSKLAPATILPYAYTGPPPTSSPPGVPFPLSQPRRPTITIPMPPPPAVMAPHHARRATSSSSPATSLSTPYDNASDYSASTSSLTTSSEDAAHRIIISPAYYDEDPAPEGPATHTGPFPPFLLKNATSEPFGGAYRFGSAERDVHTAECRSARACGIAATAGFIRPFDDDDASSLASRAEIGSLDSFDFDALPPREDARAPCICGSSAVPSSAALPHAAARAYEKDEKEAMSPRALEEGHPPRCAELSPTTMLARAQYKCKRVPPPPVSPDEPDEPRCKAAYVRPEPEVVLAQERRTRAVPAFGPLTKVLSPVVTRAQWEIVMRSMALAALASLVFVGSLLAVPPRLR